MSGETGGAVARSVGAILSAGLLLLAVVGCASSSQLETASPSTPSATSSGEATTLRTLIDSPPQSPTLSMIEELPGTDSYSSALVSYESEGLTILAVRRTPVGEGPFPGVVMVHGSIDPAAWSAQRIYVPEQVRLVESGYVVLVPDLRNYGDSDDDPDWAFDLEMGATTDAINAARALRVETDVSSVAVLGHSMGGAIALNALVVEPDIATAFVAFAPSNPSPWVNIETFNAGTPFFEEIVGLRGTPEDNPGFWADVTSTTFADRAAAPVLIIQGTADEVTPPVWADETTAAFRAAGAEVELLVVEGADHGFQPDPAKPWAAVLAFLASHS